MKIKYNETFKQLLSEYNLSEDFSFSVDFPAEIQEMLRDKIIISTLGIQLKKFGRLHKPKETWETKSIIEDSENHFHVDWYIEPEDNKNAFSLGIKTLLSLAEKFENEKISGIRFWYSFQPPELAEKWAKHNNVFDEDEQHYISDRLSFFTLRKDEEIIEIKENENLSHAILTIDI
ncbi:hypothetical protein [Parabacteroides sp. FAFU027]|uniref:hypothetical protein n=1 Tax=Parabacteroides sp. FAFU027 TaxID=2922715 RepID=UPI001FAF0D03|nr:hypothetical protein [Parabacteroides sp. FAFU027]